jgi:serine/threonine-protein kinase RsbT
VPDARRVAINNDLDIVAARAEGRRLAQEMGFDIIDQARIATVISELARNVVLHAHCGQVLLEEIRLGERVGIQTVCEDQGPGISDFEEILEAGEVASGVLTHVGLAGTKRLMDDLEIESQEGLGTTVRARRWLS